jgi:hypothetical protein
MKGSRLFSDRPTPATVSVVEPSMSRWYAHRARIAFFATLVVAGVLSAAVASQVVRMPSPLMTAVAAVGLGAVFGAVCGFAVAVVVRVWPVLRLLWWWLLEIAMSAALLTMWWLLAQVSSWLAAAVLTGLAVTLGVVGHLRRSVVAWAWCAVVRHRLRLCFAEFIRSASRARSRPMVLPLVLWARPTPAGERVWVWLRPGLDLADLEGGAGRMAVACWASEIRVQRASARYAALIRVDVARRDPLTGLVVSPLAGRFRELETTRPAPELPSYVLSGLDLDGVPDPPPQDPRDRRN